VLRASARLPAGAWGAGAMRGGAWRTRLDGSDGATKRRMYALTPQQLADELAAIEAKSA